MYSRMFTLIAARLLLVGCTRPVFSEAPDIEGYVTKKKNQRGLVVSTTPKDFGSTGGIRSFTMPSGCRMLLIKSVPVKRFKWGTPVR